MTLANDWKDYEIIDTSNGEKLERWNDIYLLRPDPQIIWDNGNLKDKYDNIKHCMVHIDPYSISNEKEE